MNYRTSQQRIVRDLFLRPLALLMIIFANGCGSGDTDSVVVDFNKTIATARYELKVSGSRSLKVAVGAMISPKETVVYYRQLLDYLSTRLNMEPQLIQRKTYDEINALLGQNQIDVAFLCSGPYASGRTKYNFEALAVPVVRGSYFYRSYLIVNKESDIQHFEDLKGRVFAFTDPDSNTGRLIPAYWLALRGETAERFFTKFIYTYSHDNSIMAVARGLVDGAAVDELIWEYYHDKYPDVTSGTRIIKASDPFGIPPVVTPGGMDEELKERIRQTLFSMHLDPDGQKILSALMIDRFISPPEQWFQSISGIEKMIVSLERQNGVASKPQE